jgi:hypothetical protein
MILIGADEQAGGEAVKAPFRRLSGGFKQPQAVAFDTAVLNILRHRPNERPQTVVIFLNQGQTDGLGIVPDTVPPGTVFRKGVDVGIIPKAGNFQSFPPKNLNRPVGTGGTANMEQNLHKKPPKTLTFHYNTPLFRLQENKMINGCLSS